MNDLVNNYNQSPLGLYYFSLWSLPLPFACRFVCHEIKTINLQSDHFGSVSIINLARNLHTEYIKLNSNVTFLNKVKFRQTLDEVPEYSVLTIDGSDCNFIDYDILEIISEFENKAHDRHIEMHLIGIEKVSITSFH